MASLAEDPADAAAAAAAAATAAATAAASVPAAAAPAEEAAVPPPQPAEAVAAEAASRGAAEVRTSPSAETAAGDGSGGGGARGEAAAGASEGGEAAAEPAEAAAETPPKKRRRLGGSAGLAIPSGAHAILRDTEGVQKVFQLATGGKDIRMGKYPPIPVDALLGVPYGATLRFVEGDRWVRHRPCDVEEVTSALGGGGDGGDGAEAGAVGGGGDGGGEITEDNRNFAQDNSAQALQGMDIQELKQRCSGDEVVKAIASQSATFANRTKFSQEKYIKKKQQKHVRQVTVLRPTLMELCETYLKTARQRVCNLRFDYLSSAVCQAHVRPGGRYLVLDCAMGLVAGAVARQLDGSGRVFRVFAGGCSDKALVEMDLGNAKSTVRQLPLDVVCSPAPFDTEWVRMPEQDKQHASAQTEQERGWFEGRLRRVRQRRGDLEALLRGGGLDAALVVASEDDAAQAAQVIELAMQRLAANGRLVVLGQNLQPLAMRQGQLRAGGWVDVRLHQLFTREYQVLPQRTHPHMAAEVQHCEGFLLMATRVMEAADARAKGPCGQGCGLANDKKLEPVATVASAAAS